MSPTHIQTRTHTQHFPVKAADGRRLQDVCKRTFAWRWFLKAAAGIFGRITAWQEFVEKPGTASGKERCCLCLQASRLHTARSTSGLLCHDEKWSYVPWMRLFLMVSPAEWMCAEVIRGHQGCNESCCHHNCRTRNHNKASQQDSQHISINKSSFVKRAMLSHS